MGKSKMLTVALIFSSIAAFGANPPKQRISENQAKKIALAKVRGTVKSSELEFENEKWIYSFDIKAKDGIHEVHVDAVKGNIIDHKMETAEEERAEGISEGK